MNKEEIYNYCKNELYIKNIKINEKMSKHTSFKIGGNADIFIKIENIDEIAKILKFSHENKINVTIIGNGTNILVKDNGIRGIVLKIDLKNIKINKQNQENNNSILKITVGAGVVLSALSQKLLKESISGLEFASGIPGTIGGAIRMNAGAYGGEFKDLVYETKCMDYDGNIIILDNEQQKFSYRNSIFSTKKLIILETILILKIEKNSNIIKQKMEEYLNSRKLKQPITMPSAGSTFKRGENYITAKLIDECGLKGFQIGGAKVSEKHAGFVINSDNATAKDVIDLIKYIKEKVNEKYGIKIKEEIRIVGEE